MMPLRVAAVAALSVLAVVRAAPAAAQTTSGGIAGATISGVRIEDATSASIAGEIGYRFNPIVALGVELMAVPSLTADIPELPTPLGLSGLDGVSYPSAVIFPPPIAVESGGGHATIFTAHLRLTIPARWRRLSPYLVAGAGVGSVTDTLRYSIFYPPIILPGSARPSIASPALLQPRIESIARRTTDFAATFGGGVSFLTGAHWSLDLDARYYGIFGARDARIGRIGGGVTYRF